MSSIMKHLPSDNGSRQGDDPDLEAFRRQWPADDDRSSLNALSQAAVDQAFLRDYGNGASAEACNLMHSPVKPLTQDEWLAQMRMRHPKQELNLNFEGPDDPRT